MSNRTDINATQPRAHPLQHIADQLRKADLLRNAAKQDREDWRPSKQDREDWMPSNAARNATQPRVHPLQHIADQLRKADLLRKAAKQDREDWRPSKQDREDWRPSKQDREDWRPSKQDREEDLKAAREEFKEYKAAKAAHECWQECREIDYDAYDTV
jgi:hypothetical protein